MASEKKDFSFGDNLSSVKSGNKETFLSFSLRGQLKKMTDTTYEEIMSENGGGADGLSSRLGAFRSWITEEAKMTVHPSICIVNGEATDGTKNAPVLIFGPPPGSQPVAPTTGDGRVGVVDGVAERSLYERTIGCQVRTARQINEDEVMMTCPKAAMITPDTVASSDAGRAVLACCKALPSGGTNFWDVFRLMRAGIMLRNWTRDDNQGLSSRLPFGGTKFCTEQHVYDESILSYCTMDAYQHPVGLHKDLGDLISYHANYIVGHEEKINRLKELQLWHSSLNSC